MRWSRAHIPTLRDAPQEAEVVSHQLMMRAGMIRRLASGIYSFLPLGWRVISKVEKIIREEMDAAGAQEVQLPVVQPRELWEEAGRWQIYGKELGRFTDRHEHEFCLQPTSEEAITDLVRRDVKSYKQLPLNLYQIQTKFRDEIRPRFGIMRGREFIMKDAYSFDLDEKAAIQSYEIMRKTYRRIFLRMGLKFKPVDADSGTIGGSRSEEFTVLADSGEDEIVSCSQCHYGANQEKARGKVALPEKTQNPPAKEIFPTPGLKTIDDLAKSLQSENSKMMKTMIATDEKGKIIVVVLRGDHELHEVKLGAVLQQHLKMKGVRLATDAELQEWNLPKGSLGPSEFPRPCLVIADDAISLDAAYVTGANKDGFHFKNMILNRDATVKLQATVRRVTDGEACVLCGGKLQIVRGIEVGHVFYLGKKYSEAMKVAVLNESQQSTTLEMGCYGIGVGRTMAACIEQNNDKDGIKWPLSLAPYEVSVISLGEGEAATLAEKIYKELRAKNLEVIWDDRALSPGVKLKDSDLVGIPFQIVIGEKGIKAGQLEWKDRFRGTKGQVAVSDIASFVISEIDKEKRALQGKLEEAAV